MDNGSASRSQDLKEKDEPTREVQNELGQFLDVDAPRTSKNKSISQQIHADTLDGADDLAANSLRLASESIDQRAGSSNKADNEKTSSSVPENKSLEEKKMNSSQHSPASESSKARVLSVSPLRGARRG